MVLHDLAFYGFLHCYGRSYDTITIGWVGYVKVDLKFHHTVLSRLLEFVAVGYEHLNQISLIKNSWT
jgi:hypothetical protein